MAKKIVAFVKLALAAGKATPAPPVGPALGQHGLNIAGFVKNTMQKLQIRLVSLFQLKLQFMMTAHIHSF